MIGRLGRIVEAQHPFRYHKIVGNVREETETADDSRHNGLVAEPLWKLKVNMASTMLKQIESILENSFTSNFQKYIKLDFQEF